MKAIYQTPFGKFVKSNFKTLTNFKRLLHISEPTARLYLMHPSRMRVKDVNAITELTGLSRDEVYKYITTTERINDEHHD